MRQRLEGGWQWQPIETAPKDPDYGPFLIYDPAGKKRPVKIAEWFKSGASSGIRDTNAGGVRREATHWMPLPEPPK